MSGIGNPIFDNTLTALKDAFHKTRAPIWKSVSEELLKSRSHRPYVNIGKISKLTKSSDIVVVPGKVLGGGILTHRITIGALIFSRSAAEKISKKRGKALTLDKFVEKYRDGKDVVLIGG